MALKGAADVFLQQGMGLWGRVRWGRRFCGQGNLPGGVSSRDVARERAGGRVSAGAEGNWGMGTHLGAFCALSSSDVALKRARGRVSVAAGGYWGMGDSPGGVLHAFKWRAVTWCSKGPRMGFCSSGWGGGYVWGVSRCHGR